MTTNKEKKQPVRLSTSSAARLFGVSTKTIRRAIKSNKIDYIVVSGRYKISFESLVKWSQRKTARKKKTNEKGIGQFVEKWKLSNPKKAPTREEAKQQKD